jgi:hypothetical protein
MGKHWVQARVVIHRYADDGTYKTYQAGDWFEVRNQELLQLQAAHQINTTAEILKATFDFTQCGVLWRGAPGHTAALDVYGIASRTTSTLDLPWFYTLLALPATVLSAQNIALGFLRVEDVADWENWEIAACLQSGLPLAADRSTDAERAATLAAVGDLRIPLYATGCLWVRRTVTTAALLAAWDAELRAGADPDQAFVRALYTRRVRVCTLPPDWVGATPGPL